MPNYLKMSRNLSKAGEKLILGLTPAEDRLLRMVSKSERSIPTHSAAGIAATKRSNWLIRNNPKFTDLGLKTSKVPTRVTGVKANTKYTVTPTNRLLKKQHGRPSALVRTEQRPMEITAEVVRPAEMPAVEVLSGPTKGRWAQQLRVVEPEVLVISRPTQIREQPSYFEPQYYMEEPSYFGNHWENGLDDLNMGTAASLALDSLFL